MAIPETTATSEFQPADEPLDERLRSGRRLDGGRRRDVRRQVGADDRDVDRGQRHLLGDRGALRPQLLQVGLALGEGVLRDDDGVVRRRGGQQVGHAVDRELHRVDAGVQVLGGPGHVLLGQVDLSRRPRARAGRSASGTPRPRGAGWSAWRCRPPSRSAACSARSSTRPSASSVSRTIASAATRGSSTAIATSPVWMTWRLASAVLAAGATEPSAPCLGHRPGVGAALVGADGTLLGAAVVLRVGGAVVAVAAAPPPLQALRAAARAMTPATTRRVVRARTVGAGLLVVGFMAVNVGPRASAAGWL